MVKKIIIRQPAGIGDIFFTQKIAYALNLFYKVNVIWPVIPEFIWIKDYLKVPFIEFVNWEEDFEGKQILMSNDVSNSFIFDDYLIVPLQRADWNYPGLSVMDSKYKLVDLDYEDWNDFFHFERNKEKEDRLFYEVLGLTDESEFVLVNRQFGSPPTTQICKYIDVSNFSNYVEMSYLEGYTIFDWCKVIEKAKEIHTVETSLNFIIDKINPKGKLEMYSKHTPPSYSQVQHLFKSKWNYNV
jgi:hypothetical protein